MSEPPNGDAPVSLECIVCHFTAEVDDVELVTQRGIVCTRCVHRLAEDEVRMTPKLMRDLRQTVNGAP